MYKLKSNCGFIVTYRDDETQSELCLDYISDIGKYQVFTPFAQCRRFIYHGEQRSIAGNERLYYAELQKLASVSERSKWRLSALLKHYKKEFDNNED